MQPQNSASTPRGTFKTPRRSTPFIWDEDISPIIPDSQDLLASGSYRPSLTQVSRNRETSLPTSSSRDQEPTRSAPSGQLATQLSSSQHLSKDSAEEPVSRTQISSASRPSSVQQPSLQSSQQSGHNGPLFKGSNFTDSASHNQATRQSSAHLREEIEREKDQPSNSVDQARTSPDAEHLQFQTQIPLSWPDEDSENNPIIDEVHRSK